MANAVTAVPAAPPESVIAHVEAELSFETDCWDTHDALQQPQPGTGAEIERDLETPPRE